MEKEFYDQIEKYNLGKLAPADAEKFESAMRADPELAAAVETHRTEWELRELMAEDLLRADIRKHFADLPAEAPEISENRPSKNWKWALLALFILGVAGFFVFRNSQKPSPELPPSVPKNEALPEKAQDQIAPAKPDSVASKPKTPVAKAPKQPDFRQIALANYQTSEGFSGIRGATDDDTLALATKAFNEKNYGQTLKLLSNLPENAKQESLLLRAHAHFRIGNFQAASRDFSDLEAGGVYRREAEWFGFLSKLAVPGSDKSELRNALDKMRRQPRHPFQQVAERCWGALGF